MSKEKYKLEETCYVLVRTSKTHPITYDRFDFHWYPETGMSLTEQMNYKRYKKSIITENPWLIACYPRENVRVWDKERGWVRPNRQTYGASVNGITMTLLGFRTTIPSQVMDGGKQLAKEIKEIEDSY